MYKNNYPHKRYRITLEFLKKYIDTNEEILDLGVPNPFSEIMKKNNYTVFNTQGEDLDTEFSTVKKSNASTVTAFEIFEHLVAPLNVLREIKGNSNTTIFALIQLINLANCLVFYDFFLNRSFRSYIFI